MAILQQDFRRIQIGDIITFKAVCRWNTRKVTRQVIETFHNQPSNSNLVAVSNYAGYTKFYVRSQEIFSVNKQKEAASCKS